MTNIDPPILNALLGKPSPRERGRWRPCWWRISALAFTVGFWFILGWGVTLFLGSRS